MLGLDPSISCKRFSGRRRAPPENDEKRHSTRALAPIPLRAPPGLTKRRGADSMTPCCNRLI